MLDEGSLIHTIGNNMATHALCRIISKLGIMSRKQAGDAIIAGRVSLNNVIVTDPGIQAALKDSIAIDGKKYQSKQRLMFFLTSQGDMSRQGMTRREERLFIRF